MADPPKEDQPQKRPEIRYDDIVANVVSDPSKGSEATLIAGYVGRGTEGRVRIYPDLSFATYHDVAEEDIVHSIPIPDAPHGGSYVWVKSTAAPGGAAAGGAQAARPFTVYPQITCGFVCHTQQDCPGAAAAAQVQAGPTGYYTCPPHICTETIAPTRNYTCPPHICTETIVPTRNYTCPAHICTETMVPTRYLTCPPHICTETMPPTRHATCLCVDPQAVQGAAAVAPQPTMYQTCGRFDCTMGANCQPSHHPGPCGTQLCFGAGAAAAAAMPTPTATFNPTQCTRCFICPPITAPQTRTGVFCPYG
jgi:hypothetical protein